jgi:hypothetical protein
MAREFKDPVLRRFAKAKAQARKWDGILTEAYEYAKLTYNDYDGSTVGTQKDVEIFDGTAANAVEERGKKLHGELFPPFREFEDFEGDADVDGQHENEWKEHLDLVRKKYHQAIEKSNFHSEIDVSLRDAVISTGCLKLEMGTLDNPLIFEAVKPREIIPEEARDGVIRTVFREFKATNRDIKTMWKKKDLKLPEDLSKKIDENPDEKTSLIEATIFNEETRDFDYSVWISKSGDNREDKIVEIKNMESSPWIVFRENKETGEIIGSSAYLRNLGDVKTANTAIELILKNAAISMSGIWQADDDGVINPANIRLAPGTIIPKAVGSKGLTPLEAPGRFDVSQIILKDFQGKIEKSIKGPTLPLVSDGIRTAEEISQRRADEVSIGLPKSLRLLTETAPLAERILYILQHPSMAGSKYYIPPFKKSTGAIDEEGNEQFLEIKPVACSPIVKIQDQVDVENAIQTRMLALQVLGAEVVEIRSPSDAFCKWIFEKSNYPTELIVDDDKAAKKQAEVDLEKEKIAEAEQMNEVMKNAA